MPHALLFSICPPFCSALIRVNPPPILQPPPLLSRWSAIIEKNISLRSAKRFLCMKPIKRRLPSAKQPSGVILAANQIALTKSRRRKISRSATETACAVELMYGASFIK